MKNHSVSWKEGMFLLPQHFQQQEQHQAEQYGIGSHIDHPHCYGFRDLQIDEEAFQNWQLSISKANGRCKDGAQFDLEAGEITRLDIKSHKDGEVERRLRDGEKVTAYIGFSRIKPNEKNISLDGELARFHEFESEIFDYRTGDRHQQIVLKKMAAGLFFSNEKTTEFEFLPLCQLELVDSAQGQIPKLSPSFIPPSTVSKASRQAIVYFEKQEDRLMGYLRSLVDYIEAEEIKIVSMASPENSENVFRFQVLSELRTWLVCHNRSQGFHPFHFFQFLCQIIGRLAIVDPGNLLMPEIPVYDHDNPYASLDWAWRYIQRHYVNPGESRIRRIPLFGEEMQTESGMEVVSKTRGLKREYFDKDRWALYMGIYYGNMDRNDAKLFFGSYLKNAKLFYWKLGDQENINSYFLKRIKGVDFDHLEKKKPHLEPKKSWFFADIEDDEYWDQVKHSLTMCLRIDQQNLVTKKSDLGSEDITVVIEEHGTKKTFSFRVSLWAVSRG